MSCFTSVWDGSPSKVRPFFHQCLSYDVTAVENDHGCRKTQESILSLKTCREKVLFEYAVLCNYLCFHILGGRCSHTALPGRSGVSAGGPASTPSCCRWESGREDLGWTEMRDGEGHCRETAAGYVSSLEKLKKTNKRGKKQIPLRSVECFPIKSHYSGLTFIAVFLNTRVFQHHQKKH